MRPLQQGMSLIEVLIAALVLAIGLLGLAALQAKGLQSSHSSNLRSQSTLFAYDMADRMRANLVGFEQGAYNKPAAADHDCSWDGSQPAACTPQEMAEHDVWEWNLAIAEALPQGIGVVCLDSTPNDGTDADADGVVETTEFACDDTGSAYVVKLWSVDEFAKDASGEPVALISGTMTEIHP